MKIFAVGMNYAAHHRELHDTLKKPEEPVVFTKADSALLKPGRPFFVPDHLGQIDYEAEVHLPLRQEHPHPLCPSLL